MKALLTDRALYASSGAALALVLAAIQLGWRSVWVSTTASLGPIAVGVGLASADRTRFFANPFGHYPAWTVGVFACSLAALGFVIVEPKPRPARNIRLMVGLATLACSLFLFVPETNILRVVPVPLIIVTIAVLAARIDPTPVLVSGGILAALLWAAAIEGTARSTTLLGTAVGVGLIVLLLRATNRSLLVALPGWIVIGPAFIGRTESVSAAAGLCVGVFLLGAVFAFWPSDLSTLKVGRRSDGA